MAIEMCCKAQSGMNVLRRRFAAAALRSLAHSRPQLRSAPSLPSHSAPASFATKPLSCNIRAFSAGNAQPSSEENASHEGGNSESKDDATVKKVGQGRWKWIGVAVALTGMRSCMLARTKSAF